MKKDSYGLKRRSTEPEWKQLELLVASIQEQLAPDAKIIHNATLPGILSGTDRQIDVLVEQNVGQYQMRVVIDCKDYAKPVDVKGVEEFNGLMQDVGAHRGALVCPRGFSKSARKRAAALQIDLYSPVDTDPHKWQAKVSASVLCDFRNAVMSFKIRCSVPKPFLLQEDFYRREVFDEDRNLIGVPLEVAKERWNNCEFPDDLGEHKDLEVFPNTRTFIDNGYGELVEVTLTVSLGVTRKRYFGQLPIEELKGLKDEQTGLVLTNALTTGRINTEEIERTWEKLEEGEEPPAPLLMVFYGHTVFTVD